MTCAEAAGFTTSLLRNLEAVYSRAASTARSEAILFRCSARVGAIEQPTSSDLAFDQQERVGRGTSHSCRQDRATRVMSVRSASIVAAEILGTHVVRGEKSHVSMNAQTAPREWIPVTE